MWVSWLINTVLSWMEWGNCHLDSMSCSEKAQLVGVVEGAPWQSYTNSILWFCCSFFILGLAFTSLSGGWSLHPYDCQQSTQQIIYLQYSQSWTAMMSSRGSKVKVLTWYGVNVLTKYEIGKRKVRFHLNSSTSDHIEPFTGSSSSSKAKHLQWFMICLSD